MREAPPDSSQLRGARVRAVPLRIPKMRFQDAAIRLLLAEWRMRLLGAIGISRMLAMVGTEDDVPDIRTAIWNAENLRQKIPDLLILRSSKDLAAERIREMDAFVEDLRYSTAKLKLL